MTNVRDFGRLFGLLFICYLVCSRALWDELVGEGVGVFVLSGRNSVSTYTLSGRNSLKDQLTFVAALVPRWTSFLPWRNKEMTL